MEINFVMVSISEAEVKRLNRAYLSLAIKLPQMGQFSRDIVDASHVLFRRAAPQQV